MGTPAASIHIPACVSPSLKFAIYMAAINMHGLDEHYYQSIKAGVKLRGHATKYAAKHMSDKRKYPRRDVRSPSWLIFFRMV